MNNSSSKLGPDYKTLVSVGNAKQHFTRFLNLIHKQLACLPRPILIQHGHTPFESNDCDLIDFINMDQFCYYVEHAEILLLHAGAGSILHSLRAGKCPIIMPRQAKYKEHVNDHQVDFAQALSEEGKVILIQDDCDLQYEILNSKKMKNISTNNFSQAEKIMKEVLNNL